MKTEGSKIRCGVIGLGRIGSSLEDDPYREKPASHAGAIHGHGETILSCGYDSDSSQRREFQRRWPESRVYTDAMRMFSEQELEILHVATHADSHAEYVALGVQNKIPVIVCEKPLTATYQASLALLKKVSSSTSKIMVNHERRFAKDYLHARKVVCEKLYGQLLTVNAKLFMGRRTKLKQVLWHDGTHLLDILRFISGKEVSIQHVQGNVHKGGGNLLCLAKLGESDLMLEIGGGRDHLVFEIECSFERGRLKIGNGIYEESRSDVSPYYAGARSLRHESRFRFDKTKYFSGMMEAAVQAVKEKDFYPDSNIKDGLIAMRLIEEIISCADK